MANFRQKVLVALSGGVDSAVAAALLLKAGYEVQGAFIKCYTNDSRIGANKYANPCWIDERRDAMRVAAKLGVKLLTFDFEKEYRRFVVDYLFREYKAGRTPNPDVICNQRVKIPLLLREANPPAGGLGFDYIATGHYARLRQVNQVIGYRSKDTRYKKQIISNPPAGGQYPICKLLEAVDKNKDQTYFLHQLNQSQLKHILFPLGEYTKPEVRKLAKRLGLSVADKEESMGICFIGERKMGEFLGQRLKDKPGDIVNIRGKKLGRHRGLFLYTIGQRQGLGLAPPMRRAYFVVEKDLERNRLIVAPGENHPALFKKTCLVRPAHWIAGQPPKFPLKCEVRLRHRQPLQECIVTRQRVGYRVVFDQPQRAVTPGQFAVFYLEEECLGGGEIAGDTSLRATCLPDRQERSNPVVN